VTGSYNTGLKNRQTMGVALSAGKFAIICLLDNYLMDKKELPNDIQEQ